MMYCVNCTLNLAGIELTEEGFCPLCDSPIREIKSTKLADLLIELNIAVESLKASAKTAPREIIAISRIIEKGEKKLKKERERRLELLKDIDYEIAVINSFSEFMGYTETVSRKDESNADSNPIEQH